MADRIAATGWYVYFQVLPGIRVSDLRQSHIKYIPELIILFYPQIARYFIIYQHEASPVDNQRKTTTNTGLYQQIGSLLIYGFGNASKPCSYCQYRQSVHRTGSCQLYNPGGQKVYSRLNFKVCSGYQQNIHGAKLNLYLNFYRLCPLNLPSCTFNLTPSAV